MVTLAHPWGLRLSCDVLLEADALALTYTLDNHSELSIAAFNRFAIASPDGSSRLSPEGAYRDLAADTLTVSMLTLEVPPGLRVAEREVPFVTRIAPGHRFAETVRFARPVTLHSPYREALMRASAPPGHTVTATRGARATNVRFDLAVTRITPPVSLREDAPGVQRLWPPGPALASAAILSLDVAPEGVIDVLDFEVVPRPDPTH